MELHRSNHYFNMHKSRKQKKATTAATAVTVDPELAKKLEERSKRFATAVV